MKNIPNIFTLLNLFFGCCAIVYCFQVEYVYNDNGEYSTWIILPEKLFISSLFIGLACIVDFLDGFLARLMNQTSELGKQLDSLSDVVSFGVAPSMIVYSFLQQTNLRFSDDIIVPKIMLIPAFIIAMSAAFRLATFNIHQSNDDNFIGVPTPAIGILTASFPLIYWTNTNIYIFNIINSSIFWYLYIIVISYLMVAKIPIFSLKNLTKSSTKKNIFIGLLIIGIVGIFFLKWLIIPLEFILYVLASIYFLKPSQNKL